MPGRRTSGESYEFLDCGYGRRLERFSGVIVARSAPAAAREPALPGEIWEKADLRFEPGKGWSGEPPELWRVNLGGAILNLLPAGRGQVGVFPEHQTVCRLLERRIASRQDLAGGARVLNLFAHTGLATLRLAARSEVAEVVHVDASGRAVTGARKNAEASGLAGARIRWLIDDALSLLAREVRRGNTYDFVLADPPSHGRDRKSGREWRFERDIGDLLGLAAKLLEPRRGALCLTCHREGWSGKDVARLMDGISDMPRGREITALTLVSRVGGNPLAAGYAVTAFPDGRDGARRR